MNGKQATNSLPSASATLGSDKHVGSLKARRRESPWLWVIVAMVILLPVLLIAGVASCFRSGSDTRALFAQLKPCTHSEWQEQFAVNVGDWTLGAVRTGLSFANVDNEVLSVLKSVRGVEIGAYQLLSHLDSCDSANLLDAADNSMKAGGWERVVGVISNGTLVAVYAPASIASPRKMKCCVLVVNGRQAILASVRANPEPLVQCALRHPTLRARLQLLAQR